MVRDHCIFVMLCSFTHHFIIKLLFLGWTRIQWYLLPQAKFHLAIAASCLRLLKPIGKTKNGEKPFHACNFAFLPLTIFLVKLLFQGEPAINHIFSQRPNSACCCHHQLAFIKTERRQKKNGEKPSHILYFTALFLTNFSIKLLFWGWTRIQLKLLLQVNFTPSSPPPSHIY